MMVSAGTSLGPTRCKLTPRAFYCPACTTEFSLTIRSAKEEDTSRQQLILDLACAIDFNRHLDCVANCEVTARLWCEAHPLDISTLVVGWMSDAAVAYILGSGSISDVEAADTWNGAGIYELSQSCDAQRTGKYIGKSDISIANRMKSDRAAKKTKNSSLYRHLRAFQAREFHELLLVPIPSALPQWFRSLWRHLPPPRTALQYSEPLSSIVMRSSFVSMVEAAFIALRRSFRKHRPYEEIADQTFRTPAGTIGLNSTPGTENNTAYVLGLLHFYAGYRPAVEILRSQLLNQLAVEPGGLPQPRLKKRDKYDKTGHVWSWRLPGHGLSHRTAMSGGRSLRLALECRQRGVPARSTSRARARF